LPWHKNSTSPFGAMTGRGCSRTGQDVSKLGMTYFLRTFDEEGHSPFLAIPVFPVRAFRHGAIYISRNSGIEKPQNLVGKRIGELALYGHDAGVIPKGHTRVKNRAL